jgi:putative membrane protein
VQSGIIFGLQVLTLPTIITDLVTWIFFTKGDTVFTLRRCANLSFFTCATWIFLLIFGGVLQLVIPEVDLFTYFSCFGVCTGITLRFLAFKSLSSMNKWKILLSTTLQPFVCFVSTLKFWDIWTLNFIFRYFIGGLILLAAMNLFISLVDKKGTETIGIGTISLLKGFANNWIANRTDPLEEYLYQLGEDSDINFSILAFKENKENRLKSIMLVPALHPGPFRNIGSSNFPYLAQRRLEKISDLVAVPHGCSGHGQNVTSQHEVDKVFNEVFKAVKQLEFNDLATKMVRVKKGGTHATCQAFGEHALVTLSRSPYSTEDIPRELGQKIMKEGEKLGFKSVTVVDAHNSIGDPDKIPFFSSEELEEIEEAAMEVIKKTLRQKKYQFKTGVSRIVPKEFGLIDGMGPGGIIVFVLEVFDQKIAYVIIDGNNMVSGFREEILISILNNGLDDGEVMTTDTHVVNAVSLIQRGYHPIGEAFNKDRFIYYVNKGIKIALANIKTCEIACKIGSVKNVRTLGKEKVVELSIFTDSTIRHAKNLAFKIFPPTLLITIAFLFTPFLW